MSAPLGSKPQTTAQEVRALAKANGITAEKTGIDRFSDLLAELAGDSAVNDEIDIMISKLVQVNVITPDESFSLLGRYLREQ